MDEAEAAITPLIAYLDAKKEAALQALIQGLAKMYGFDQPALTLHTPAGRPPPQRP